MVEGAAEGRGLTAHRVELPGAMFLRVAGEVGLFTAPDLAAALTQAAASTQAPHPSSSTSRTSPTSARPASPSCRPCRRRCRDAGAGLRIVVGPRGPHLPADEHGLDVFGDLASAAA